MPILGDFLLQNFHFQSYDVDFFHRAVTDFLHIGTNALNN